MTPEFPNGNINNIASTHNENRSMRYAWANTLTLKKTFQQVHDLTLLLGFSAEKNNSEASALTGQSGTFDNDLVNYVTGASIITAAANKEQWSLLSYLGRLNYAFKNKYLLTASVRKTVQAVLRQIINGLPSPPYHWPGSLLKSLFLSS
ncbi:hypothetical protein ACFJIV_06395 [Mucilaginibacter sp. UC70_90]